MSQAKIDEYKKEKANRRSNMKKARKKQILTRTIWSIAGVVVAGLLIWGIVATVKDGGLGKIKDQQTQEEQKQIALDEFLEYINSSNINTDADTDADADAGTDTDADVNTDAETDTGK